MTMQRSATLEAESIGTNGNYTNGINATAEYVPEALYWEKYYESSDSGYEWNNGQLEELPVTDHAKYMMYLWFVDMLRDFLHVQPLARIVGLELGFRLALPTKTTIRKPDLGVVLHTNPIPLGDHHRSYRGIFDICLESLSDGSQTEIDRDVIIKREEYAAAGVQEYYLLDERGMETQFYGLNRRGVYVPLPQSNGVVRSRVLPGFQFRVADLYAKPDPRQMMADPVYSGFIAPFVRAERQRAEAAEARAEQSETRAEQLERRAEQSERRAEQSEGRAEQSERRAEAERQRAEQSERRSEQLERRAAQYASLLRAAGLLPPD
ncbi:MAG: Uma2 family endonuclease [Caldilineaceae bacterium]|nr:Uma2 family endonuclease [Caldilineaceae bacterium]HRJ42927.1 Uma2 family endonuclease [Caldilineaceae bacterium]